MVVVKVAQGQLQGKEELLPSGGTYYSFKGVPYAQPPVGELRFKGPQPPSQWKGIREALVHGPTCSQSDMFNPSVFTGEDDCLYLNVYTRNINTNSRIPVMLWIHGGAFKSGNGNSEMYGPEILLEKNVIVVTINYRVGVLGFLCLKTLDVPGNAGLKDQVAAMQWVKENIANFGGDPNDVTIFGESAGGISVAFHLVSPMSRGLFHKAIAQSGSFFGVDWNLTKESYKFAFELGKTLGCNSTDLSIILKHLQEINSIELTKAAEELNSTLGTLAFFPCLEENIQGCQHFLNKTPLEFIQAGEVADVPVILGVVLGEGIITIQDDCNKLETLNDCPEKLLPSDLQSNRSSEEIKELGQTIKKMYFKEQSISEETIIELVDLRSDVLFVHPKFRLCNMLASYNNSPIYYYYYTYKGDRDLVGHLLKGKYAQKLSEFPGHGAELGYLFNSTIFGPPKVNLRDTNFVNSISNLWTNFVKTGNPTPGKVAIRWSRYSKEIGSYLHLDETLKLENHFLKDRMDFWNNLYREAKIPI